MTKLSLLKVVCIVSVFCAATVIPSPAQVSTTLYSFTGPDGAGPWAGLTQGTDGNFYGTTTSGGANDGGTVFKITPTGELTTLYSFDFSHGFGPFAGLVQGSDGNFYGSTYEGGADDLGVVFKITSSGTLTTLHSFAVADGTGPVAGLIQATDGNFYGTTEGGGAYDDGTVFKITPSGTLTTLDSFGGGDGASPWAGLVQASDGNFYGTTLLGNGFYNYGTVFKITPSGTLITLHSFDGSDGQRPYAGLVQASDGNFYGTTYLGAFGYGTVFRLVLTRPCIVCPSVE